MDKHDLNKPAITEQALNEVLTEYVIETANLKLVVKQLQLEIESLNEQVKGDK